MKKERKIAHLEYLLRRKNEVNEKQQEFIIELLKDKKLLELENKRLHKKLNGGY